jgi:hydrogenase maturation protease
MTVTTTTVIETESLIIGFGNESRGDDAAGPEVARRIAALELPNVRVLVAHQLTPELAEPLSTAERAYFVDARCEELGSAAESPIERIEPSEAGSFASHSLSPAQLLALSQVLYGRAPRAWMVAVDAVQFHAAEPLSPSARRRVDEAVAALKESIFEESR